MKHSLATMVIWIVFASLVGGLLTASTGAIANADGIYLFSIVLVLAVAAGISTVMIWASAITETRRDQAASHLARGLPLAKAKNRDTQADRIERLIATLNDQDIYELEARLLARGSKQASQDDEP